MTNNITYEHKDLYDLLTDKTPPNVPSHDYLAFPPGVEMELVGIEKNELARLKSMEKRCMEEAATRARDSVTDCKILVNKLLQIKPELKEWLEVNFKEYL